jgi:hypothetical protein
LKVREWVEVGNYLIVSEGGVEGLRIKTEGLARRPRAMRGKR